MAPKKTSAAKAPTITGGITKPVTRSTAASTTSAGPTLRRSSRIAAAKAAVKAAETEPDHVAPDVTVTGRGSKATTKAAAKPKPVAKTKTVKTSSGPPPKVKKPPGKKAKGPSKPTKGSKKSDTVSGPAATVKLRRGRSASKSNPDAEPEVESEAPASPDPVIEPETPAEIPGTPPTTAGPATASHEPVIEPETPKSSEPVVDPKTPAEIPSTPHATAEPAPTSPPEDPEDETEETPPGKTSGPSEIADETPSRKRKASLTPIATEPSPKRAAVGVEDVVVGVDGDATRKDRPEVVEVAVVTVVGDGGVPEEVGEKTPPPVSSLEKRKTPSPRVPETPVVKRVRLEPEARTRCIWAQLKRKGVKTPSPRRILPTVLLPTVPKYSNPALNPCGHRFHPAYASTGVYDNARCPHCRMHVCLQDLRNVQQWIEFGGGLVAIQDRCNTKEKRNNIYDPLVKGIGKGKFAGITDAWNKDLSLRQSQIRLANLVLELEQLSNMELAWEKRQTAEARSSSAFREVRVRRLHSATGALARYKAECEDGTLFPAIAQEAREVRKRSQVEQEAGGPSQEEIDALATRKLWDPKRKRRCTTARVTINPEVFMRSENDIDILRKADYSRPDVLPPPVSVLRTAPPPRAVASSVTPAPSQSIRQTAWKPFLRKSGRFWYNRASVKADHQSQFNRPGTRLVDTSGSTLGSQKFSEWYEHANELQEEADRWDAADERDEREMAKYLQEVEGDTESDTEADSDVEKKELEYLRDPAAALADDLGRARARSLFEDDLGQARSLFEDDPNPVRSLFDM